MSLKWYQKASVQTAIASGIFLIVAAIISGFFILLSRNENSSPPPKNHQDSSSQRPSELVVESLIDTVKDNSSHDKEPAKRQKSIISDSGSRHIPKIPIQSPTQVFYEVILVVPSSMKDAMIFVDDEPAQVIENLPTFKTIRVKKKDSNSKIVVRKDGRICMKEQMILRSGLSITFCE